jgi:GH24 family phage-related lysozyme (muramidase)
MSKPTGVSPLGGHFIVRREAIVLVPYRDGLMIDPGDPTRQDKVERWSIGMGSLAKHGERTKSISVKQAFQQLHKAVRVREQAVLWALGLRIWFKPPAPVLQQHVDAGFSLYYQGGSDGLKAVSALVRQGKMQEAADEFLRWDMDAEGVKKKGLLARRELERDLFLTGNYGDLNPVRLYRGDPKTSQFEEYNVTERDLKGWLEPDAEDE